MYPTAYKQNNQNQQMYEQNAYSQRQPYDYAQNEF